MWLAHLLPVLLSVGGGLARQHESAPYHGYHPNRQHQQQRRQHDYGPSRPSSQFGGASSPTFGMFEAYEDDEEESTSYFERNGMSPPPLISRRAQELFDDDAEKEEETPTDIESIIYSAKHGEDANSRLRHDLIWGYDDGKYFYDKHSYPWEYIWYNQTGSVLTGVPIETNINFHRVFSVDIVDSVMDLVVWFRLVWVDPRLTWRPEEYGGLTKTWFWIGDGGAGGETSEIWTPDVELWNLETGLKGSLEDTYARVTYDGTVWWGRPGHLRPTCKFKGLDAFPFDKLTCTMEFGSWKFSGKYLRMEFHNGVGFTQGGSLTAGESYEEYSFTEEEPISSQKHLYTFKLAPEEPWPVLLYNVTVERSWQPYARGYIITQVFLNFVGFSAFWLPPSCGERMSLSVTAMLAALAAEIVIAANLPLAAEMTWFSKFSILSMTFAFVSLAQSVAVLYFYYKKSEDLVPSWYTYTKNWWLVRQGKKVKDRSAEVVNKTADFVTETTDLVVDAIQDATDGLVDTLQDATEGLVESFVGATDSFVDKLQDATDSVLGSDSGQDSDDKSIPSPKDPKASNEGPNDGSKDARIPLEVTPPATPHEDLVHANDSPNNMGIHAEVTLPTSPPNLHDNSPKADANADATPLTSPGGSSYIGDDHASETKSITSPKHSTKNSSKDADARAHPSLKLADDKTKKASSSSTVVTSSLSNSSMNGGIRVDPTTLEDYSTSLRNSFENKLANQEEALAQRPKTPTTDRRRSVGRMRSVNRRRSVAFRPAFRPPMERSLSDTMKASNIVSESSRVRRASFLPDESVQIEGPEPEPGQRRLPRRSMMLRDYQDKFGNSIITGIGLGPKNADDFNDEQEIENNQKWKYVASRIDDVARFWIPLAYIIALSIIIAEVF